MARFVLIALFASLLALPATAQDAPAPGSGAAGGDAAATMTDAQKVSYAIGLDIGTNFKQQGIEVDAATLAQGVTDAISGATPKLTQEQMQEVMMALQQSLQAKRMQQMRDAGAKNIELGNAYREANGKKDGVKTTESGLQYEVLTEGDGAKPGPTDTVKVHYTGSLIDGKVFDTSVQRGEPISFPLDGVIPGWTEGVQLMKKGAKYRFVIPPDLAYGEMGQPRAGIEPNSTLVFEVELLDIEKPAE